MKVDMCNAKRDPNHKNQYIKPQCGSKKETRKNIPLKARGKSLNIIMWNLEKTVSKKEKNAIDIVVDIFEGLKDAVEIYE